MPRRVPRVLPYVMLHVMLQCGLLLTGCVSTPRRSAPAGGDTAATVPGFPAGIRRVGESRREFQVRATRLVGLARGAADGRALEVLVLSGGGAGGAYGAGALVGWTRRGTRPEFQIVTGVSAGALIAPLAFLGPDWDPQLAEAFSGAQTRHLLHTHWWGALFGASIYRGEPLAALVDRYVTDDLLRAVARESSRGRLLLVATTDLDSEEPVFWNLGLIAEQGGPRARVLFRDVLIASASVPGMFPPVMIRVEQAGKTYEEMHVDGSAIESLFFIPDIAAVLPDTIEPLRDGHLYVLVNGRVQTAPETTPDQTLAIIRRTAMATLQGGTRAAVEIAYSLAQRHGMDISVTDIPNAYPFDDPLAFDAHRMRALFDYGQRCALADQLWSSPLDALDQGAVQPRPPEVSDCPGTLARAPVLESASIAREPSLRDGLASASKGVDAAYRMSTP